MPKRKLPPCPGNGPEAVLAAVRAGSTEVVRLAMLRLLNWTPEHPDVVRDGDINTSNLAQEAGVARATVYRMPDDLMDAWATALERIRTGKEEARAPKARIRQLEHRISDYSKKVRDLESTTDVLANQIQFLSRELARARSAEATAPEINLYPIQMD